MRAFSKDRFFEITDELPPDRVEREPETDVGSPYDAAAADERPVPAEPEDWLESERAEDLFDFPAEETQTQERRSLDRKHAGQRPGLRWMGLALAGGAAFYALILAQTLRGEDPRPTRDAPQTKRVAERPPPHELPRVGRTQSAHKRPRTKRKHRTAARAVQAKPPRPPTTLAAVPQARAAASQREFTFER